MPSFELPEAIWDNSYESEFVTTIHAMGQVYRRILEPFGLTIAQSIVLFRIANNQGATQAQLAELALRDAPGMTRLLDNLEGLQLIERRPDPHDRRKRRVRLTRSGRTYTRRILAAYQAAADRLGDNITEADVAALRRVAKKLRGNYERFLADSEGSP